MMPTVRLTFPVSHRVRSRDDYRAIYDARTKWSQGPLTIYARANDLPHARIGLSTSRKVGNAPRRNRIRRLLREAFRQSQHALPGGIDLIVVVRAHEPMPLEAYRAILADAAARLAPRCRAMKEKR